MRVASVVVGSMSEPPPDELSIAVAVADSGRSKAAAEARGVSETDQLFQGRRGRRRARDKGDRIERDPCSYPVLKVAASRFDYSGISPSLVPNLQAQANLIKNIIVKTTADLIEIGRNLIAAGDRLKHGLFIPWVETEIGIRGRTAQRYMALARLAEKKSDSVSLLLPTTAHRLAAKSAPPEVVAHVLDRAVSGEIVSDSQVDEMFRNARKERKEAKKKTRRSRAALTAAYRRSESCRKKEELCHLEWEHKRKHRQEEASKFAADLIRDLGRKGSTRVVELMSSDMADDVLAELRKQLSPDDLDGQASCGGATGGASP
jgi:hypothetical protein